MKPLATLAILAGVVLAALYGYEARAPWSTALGGALLGVLLVATPRLWLGRLSGKLAVGLFSAALLVARPDSLATFGQLCLGAVQYLVVVILLLCVPLLRLPFLRGKLDAVVVARLSRVPPRHRLRAILGATVAMTPLVSLGSVAILGALLRGSSQPASAVPCTISRGVVATMLWAPTTAAVAVVMHHFPDVRWSSAVILGAPLSLAALALAALQRGALSSEPRENNADDGSVRALGLAAAILTLFTAFGYMGLDLRLTNAVSMAAVALVVLWFLAFERTSPGPALAAVAEQVDRTWRGVSPEIALFLASGFFAAALKYAGWQPATEALDALPGWLTLALLILGVPLITSLGLHPIVPFSILVDSPALHSLGISSVGLYIMWIVVFMLSMLLSPVSVLNLTAAASFGQSPWLLGVRSQWRFALALGAAASALIWLTR